MNIVFGPIISRRFGVSLGVDLSPSKKQCNFDCLYCELKASRSVESFSDILPLDILLDSVKNALKIHKNINVLTITANGEPTMYPYLKEFIIGIKPYVASNIKTLILSNGSLFGDKNVSGALKYFDIVKFSLDSLDEKSYKKIDRIHKSLNLDSIKDGIRSYAMSRKNMLICEVLLVKGINDNESSMRPLAEFLREINVDRVDLGTIDRPPAYNVESASFEKISEISKLFFDLYVSIPKRKNSELVNLLDLMEDEILELLKRRPLEIKEIRNIFSKDSINRLESLLKVNKIQTKSIGLIDFYVV
ncbi:radical SAM protein [Helicobacter sp. MIT 14-3879]|uniref:radical SAM protein n=1 Tax=Helicobacter sp. MIT 14-3879 TaxID=2040649 RepID=UPI000E1F5345|nr:radical SAM protein [Helicobacter sp. MIT 14-3879]RDU65486.1 radical SAM protein [Helicobacter sp. MIT 14-3879]